MSRPRSINPARYRPADKTVVLELSNGTEVLIDAEDYVRVREHHWMPLRQYAVAKQGSARTPIYLHRFVLNAPDTHRVDFRSDNRLDCRKSNLLAWETGQGRQLGAKLGRYKAFLDQVDPKTGDIVRPADFASVALTAEDD